MCKTMNHLSEWAKFFDKRAGQYRYKHKGPGVVRDTLMAIGKVFKKGATKVVKKTAKAATEKAGQKLSEVEKGSDKIQRLLQKCCQSKTTPSKESKNKASSKDAMIKLSQILGNQL